MQISWNVINSIQLFDRDKLQELINLKKGGERNNFSCQKIKKYWLDQIAEKENLITFELLNSQLPNFEPKEIRLKVEDFLNDFIKINYQ